MALAREVLCADRRLETTMLSGGGVPNVLLADFCCLYGLGIGGAPLPKLLVVLGECGRTILVSPRPRRAAAEFCSVGARK